MLDRSQIEEFKRLYPVTAKRDLMLKLGITSSILKNTAHKLGLRKVKGYKIKRFNRLSWPKEELELFARIYPVTSNAEIAKRLNKTIP